MEDEIQAHSHALTWELVPESEADNVITGKWVFKIKYKNGVIEKYKARWCARGFSQKKGIDYNETFSGVARNSTIKVHLAMANQENKFIKVVDVMNAFIRTEVTTHDLYIEQPHEFEEKGPNGETLVCKLNKYLYGLLQASREFNQKLKRILLEMGFHECDADNCFYVYTNTQKIQISICTYVDDLIITCICLETMNKFIKELEKDFPVTHEDLTQILGIQTEYNKTQGILKMHQEFAITQLLKDHGMDNCEIAPTPMEFNWHPDLYPDNAEATKQFPTREILGSLGHLSNQTRLDITQAVARLQREAHAPTYSVTIAIKRILQYLAGTRTYGITFQRQPELQKDFLIGYADASWGVWDKYLEATMKSTSGYVITLYGTPISWRSALQKGKPAQSSGESEYIAAYECATEESHLKNVLTHYGADFLEHPLLCYTDSSACIGMSKNPVNHKRNKHIMLKYHWLRIATDKNEIILKHLRTNEQPADLFTKVLKTHQQFRYLRDKLMTR